MKADKRRRWKAERGFFGPSLQHTQGFSAYIRPQDIVATHGWCELLQRSVQPASSRVHRSQYNLLNRSPLEGCRCVPEQCRTEQISAC
mmetsp:Transcript_18454/g.32266  ORF Transcript_18454/g.32266 Transcript_18454/m.32266 type:complete len:88 (-) Transcript_18454:27-290(-)